MCFRPDNDGELLQVKTISYASSFLGHGKNAREEYLSLTKYHADRFMSLLTYLHGEWDWGNKPNT